MKKLNKIIIVLLIIFSVLITTTLTLSITFPNILSSTVIESVKNTISSNNFKEGNIIVNENATSPEDLVTTDNEEVNKILRSKEVQDLVNDYINKTLETVSDPSKLDEIDYEQDIINYVKENKDKISKETGVTITDDMIDKASNELKEKEVNKVIKNNIRNTNNNLTQEDKEVIKLYTTFTSNTFRIILAILLIINFIIIFLLTTNKIKVLKYLSVILIVSGINIIIISISLNSILRIETKLTSINIGPMINIGLISGIIGIILIILYNIICKKKERSI